MGNSISVVIPVYNAADSLVELYQRLVSTIQKITDDFEIVMVDDHSVDKSYKQMLKLHKKDNRVKVIRLAENFGQQNALICGFNYISGNYVVTLDDDLQHRPEDIVKLYNTIKNGYEVVYGIPEDRDYNLYRKLGSKITNILFGLITPKKSDIRVSSFRIMTRKIIKKIIKEKSAFVYISVIILKHTDNIGNIYVSHKSRKHGKSNYTFIKLARLFIKLYIYHGNFPFLKILSSKKPQFIISEKVGF
ncbi:MAG: glycosyltransferase family 2 protein [Halothermotrichaceae bacterium]